MITTGINKNSGTIPISEPQIQPQNPTHTDTGAQKNPVYIVQVILPSPNRTDGRIEIDDQTDQIHYIFKDEMRKKIAALRGRVKYPIYQNLLDFPPEGETKLWMCNEDKVESIRQSVSEAEKEFQKLDTSLHTQIIFIPLNIYEIQGGELYGQIINAIRYRVLSEVIEKIEDKTGQLTEKSKEAVLKLIDRMKGINIFNDPDVTKRISEIREKIINNDLETIKNELTQELDITRKRIAYVNL